MAPVTILFGLLLIALGPIGYLLSDTKSLTAFIPAAVGAVLLICGVLALREKMRKHAMHAAAMVGLLGFLAATANAIRTAISGEIKLPLAFAMTICMGVLCGVFVALCVKSFIDARKRRRQAAGER